MQEINNILQKYNYFKYEQLRTIKQLPDSKIVVLVVQDEDGKDVVTVELTFKDISASRILENSVLSLLDMGSGITLIKENNRYGFALGSGSSMLHVQNAPLYIVASNVTVEEK